MEKDEHQMVIKAMNEAKERFNEIISDEGFDPAFFQLSLIIDFLDCELDEILETIAWTSETRDTKLERIQRK